MRSSCLGWKPPIHDITTDTLNPPPFVAILPLRVAPRIRRNMPEAPPPTSNGARIPISRRSWFT